MGEGRRKIPVNEGSSLSVKTAIQRDNKENVFSSCCL